MGIIISLSIQLSLAVSPPDKIVGFRAYMTVDCCLDFLVTRPLLAYLWYYSKPWLLRTSSPSIDLRMVSYCPERAESIRVTSFPITIGWTIRMILSTESNGNALLIVVWAISPNSVNFCFEPVSLLARGCWRWLIRIFAPGLSIGSGSTGFWFRLSDTAFFPRSLPQMYQV